MSFAYSLGLVPKKISRFTVVKINGLHLVEITEMK